MVYCGVVFFALLSVAPSASNAVMPPYQRDDGHCSVLIPPRLTQIPPAISLRTFADKTRTRLRGEGPKLEIEFRLGTGDWITPKLAIDQENAKFVIADWRIQLSQSLELSAKSYLNAFTAWARAVSQQHLTGYNALHTKAEQLAFLETHIPFLYVHREILDDVMANHEKKVRDTNSRKVGLDSLVHRVAQELMRKIQEEVRIFLREKTQPLLTEFEAEVNRSLNAIPIRYPRLAWGTLNELRQQYLGFVLEKFDHAFHSNLFKGTDFKGTQPRLNLDEMPLTYGAQWSEERLRFEFVANRQVLSYFEPRLSTVIFENHDFEKVLNRTGILSVKLHGEGTAVSNGASYNDHIPVYAEKVGEAAFAVDLPNAGVGWPISHVQEQYDWYEGLLDFMHERAQSALREAETRSASGPYTVGAFLQPKLARKAPDRMQHISFSSMYTMEQQRRNVQRQKELYGLEILDYRLNGAEDRYREMMPFFDSRPTPKNRLFGMENLFFLGRADEDALDTPNAELMAEFIERHVPGATLVVFENPSLMSDGSFVPGIDPAENTGTHLLRSTRGRVMPGTPEAEPYEKAGIAPENLPDLPYQQMLLRAHNAAHRDLLQRNLDVVPYAFQDSARKQRFETALEKHIAMVSSTMPTKQWKPQQLTFAERVFIEYGLHPQMERIRGDQAIREDLERIGIQVDRYSKADLGFLQLVFIDFGIHPVTFEVDPVRKEKLHKRDVDVEKYKRGLIGVVQFWKTRQAYVDQHKPN